MSLSRLPEDYYGSIRQGRRLPRYCLGSDSWAGKYETGRRGAGSAREKTGCGAGRREERRGVKSQRLREGAWKARGRARPLVVVRARGVPGAERQATCDSKGNWRKPAWILPSAQSRRGRRGVPVPSSCCPPSESWFRSWGDL